MNCPVCDSQAPSVGLSFDAGGFDGSPLYRRVGVSFCPCGHVFNELTKPQYVAMFDYYQNEYSVSNIQSPNQCGDLPGSSSTNTVLRHSILADAVCKHVGSDARILDVGCAMGGFLRLLRKRGYSRLFGVDACGEYAERATDGDEICVKTGTAEQIPLDGPFDLMVADQVAEHMLEPKRLFAEARRLLRPGALLCVSVPDAAEYGNNIFFPFYWFLMREHLQHFDERHLTRLAKEYGFAQVEVIRASTPMLSDDVRLPSLTIVFKAGHAECDFGGAPMLRLDNYITSCCDGLRSMREKVSRLPGRIVAYGASRELFFLVQNTELRNKLALIIDDTPFKQKQGVGGIEVKGGAALASLHDGHGLLITAFAHLKVLTKKARCMGFGGAVHSL